MAGQQCSATTDHDGACSALGTSWNFQLPVNGMFKEYHVSEYPVPWSSARDYCLQKGGTLPCVQSKAENDFLLSSFGQLWLGINDQEHEGNWQWLHGCSS